jgi:hypothetical protein
MPILLPPLTFYKSEQDTKKQQTHENRELAVIM